jgi:hypothetical protein
MTHRASFNPGRTLRQVVVSGVLIAAGAASAAPLLFRFSGTITEDRVDPAQVGTAVQGRLRFDPATAQRDDTNAISRTTSSNAVESWMSIEMSYGGGTLSNGRAGVPRNQGWAQIIDDRPSGNGFDDLIDFRVSQEGAGFEYATYLGLTLFSRDRGFVDGFDFAQALDLALLHAASGGYLRRYDGVDAQGSPQWLHDASFSITGFERVPDDPVNAVPEPGTLALVLAGLLPWRRLRRRPAA